MASQHTRLTTSCSTWSASSITRCRPRRPTGQYLEEIAQDHEDVADFIRQCQQQDSDRAVRCHELLTQLTSDGIG